MNTKTLVIPMLVIGFLYVQPGFRVNAQLELKEAPEFDEIEKQPLYDGEKEEADWQAAQELQKAGQTDKAVEKYLKVTEGTLKAKGNTFADNMTKAVCTALTAIEAGYYKDGNWAKAQNICESRLRLIQVLDGTTGKEYKAASERLGIYQDLQGKKQMK